MANSKEGHQVARIEAALEEECFSNMEACSVEVALDILAVSVVLLE